MTRDAYGVPLLAAAPAPPFVPGPERVGIAIIGRNEGERLGRCLDSVAGLGRIVYVDSGSIDDSVEHARMRGIDVVNLDMSIPFTAARARNAGFARLQELDAATAYVQFVDGDCEILPGWIPSALVALERDRSVAAVCGRLRERYPDATIYNRLCDLEWRTPVGEVTACGGIAMMRASAFRDCAGFDDALIAGEEPELCFRLRRRGYRILRLADEMALHDAAITCFGQWWRRGTRGGHAYAAIGAKHPALWRHERRSIVAWGLAIPSVMAIAMAIAGAPALLFLLAYAALWGRIAARRRREDEAGQAALYASFCVLGKFAELVGMARYWWNRLRGVPARLIEYK